MVSMVAPMFCCPDVATSGPSPPRLPALAPSASLESSQLGWGHHSCLCLSQSEDLDEGLGGPSWKLSAAVFPQQGPSWLPVMHFVLTPPGRMAAS